jgi:hypothetical protein
MGFLSPSSTVQLPKKRFGGLLAAIALLASYIPARGEPQESIRGSPCTH